MRMSNRYCPVSSYSSTPSHHFGGRVQYLWKCFSGPGTKPRRTHRTSQLLTAVLRALAPLLVASGTYSVFNHGQYGRGRPHTALSVPGAVSGLCRTGAGWLQMDLRVPNPRHDLLKDPEHFLHLTFKNRHFRRCGCRCSKNRLAV